MAILDGQPLGLAIYFTWPLVAIPLLTFLALLVGLYNLLLHPLRSFPGPKLWAASDIPYTLAWLSGRLGFVIHTLHEKHGDVVRVAPNRLSFTHPDAWRDVRGHRKTGQGEHGKDPVFYAAAANSLIAASRDNHTRIRRILSHGFAAKSIQEQQPLITQHVDLLMQRLRERTHSADGKPLPKGVVDLAAWFNFTTFDVIGDLAFGEPFGCLEESMYHPWVERILGGAKQFGMMLVVQWYLPGLLGMIKALSPRQYIGVHFDAQTEFANERIERRLALTTSRPDFVEAMATAKADDGTMLTKREIVGNARLLVAAGSETTATALSGAAYFLASHSHVQKRLAEEVRTSFASEDEIDIFSVNKLRYMLAVLDEAMRMFPPVPGNLPRVVHKGGDVICGYRVPEGTGLDIWPWAMNYSSRNFTEPKKFVPERWLSGGEHQEQVFEKKRHSALQPFSAGPRNCIGKNLAYAEMRLILARLIWNYDLAFADAASEKFIDCTGSVLWIKGPLHMQLRPVATEC